MICSFAMYKINRSTYGIKPDGLIIQEKPHVFYFLVGGEREVNYIRLFVFNEGLNSENTMMCGTNLFTEKASYTVLQIGGLSDHISQ